MKRVIALTDIRLYREGFERSLDADGRLETVPSTGIRTAALDEIGRHHPDVALVDMTMRDVETLIFEVRRMFPSIHVVALTVDEDEQQILRCMALGAAGYVTRDASLEELTNVLLATARGELHCSPRISACLLRQLSVRGEPAGDSGRRNLTRCEAKVVTGLERGLSNKEIARELRIEVSTVKNHVHSILGKLRVSRRGEVPRALATNEQGLKVPRSRTELETSRSHEERRGGGDDADHSATLRTFG